MNRAIALAALLALSGCQSAPVLLDKPVPIEYNYYDHSGLVPIVCGYQGDRAFCRPVRSI